MKKLLWSGIAVGAACVLGATSSYAVSAFTQVEETSIASTGNRNGDPVRSATFRADVLRIENELALAPLARSSSTLAPATLELPMPDGSQQMFRVYESPIMAPELAARYPELRTYEAYGVDDRSVFARFSVTPKGFHAIAFTQEGTVWVDPYQERDSDHYVSYYANDYRRTPDHFDGSWACEFVEDPERTAEIATLVAESANRGGISTGDELRTYRLALAATGEYTSFHGGTVAAGMAAIVVAMNRVNGIYQKDVSVLMELVANNDVLVYTNSGTDPYTNNNGGAMLGQNQSNIDSVIGNANYDIGHVFSTGGGGIAGLAVVCRTNNKARGVTGLPSPINDGFYVDYVAHEMGHQYGANHTFNGTAGSCAGGNRSAGHAYEPGSGSTIMAYAGICGSHNIQFRSDDYFHNDSFNAIRAWTEGPTGGACPTVAATGNTAPVVDADFGNPTIPLGTPFEFTGSAVDGEGDDMTYCWEQYNLGPGGHPNTPSGNAPIFRSFVPKDTPTRICPRIEDVVTGVQTKGEILPSYARGLTFRLTVRDGLGGTSYNSTSLTVTADGPFLVTAPSNAGLDFPANSSQVVTWDVAGTSGGSIGAANVDIFFSDDGGFTYPVTLASNVPNDGSQIVTMPGTETTTGRIKVKASDNIFFDISNFNFTITEDVSSVDDDVVSADGLILGSSPNPFRNVTHLSFRVQNEEQVSLQVYSPSGRTVAVLADGVFPAGDHTLSWNGKNMDERKMPSGVYFYNLTIGDETQTARIVLN